MAWAKSAFTTTASAAWRLPPTSTPDGAACLRRRCGPPACSSGSPTPSRSATRAIASRHRAAAADAGGRSPCSYSRKDRMVNMRRAAERAHAQVLGLEGEGEARRAGRGSGAAGRRPPSDQGRSSGSALHHVRRDHVEQRRGRRVPAPGGRRRACARFSAMKGRKPLASAGLSLAISASIRARSGVAVERDAALDPSKTSRYCGSRRMRSTSVQLRAAGCEDLAAGCADRGRRSGRGRSCSPRRVVSVRVRPPTTASFSKTVTRAPVAASSMAAARPPGPAPMMETRGRWRAEAGEASEAFMRSSRARMQASCAGELRKVAGHAAHAEAAWQLGMQRQQLGRLDLRRTRAAARGSRRAR